MPTYVYRCENCGHRFEAWQHMTDEPLSTCPQCQGHIHRVLFPASVVFKGSGFYSTDHRPTAAATEPAAAVAEKSEAKPESTSTTPTPTPAPVAAPATDAKSSSGPKA